MHDVEDTDRVVDFMNYIAHNLYLLKQCYIELPHVPNDKDISMIDKAICETPWCI